MTLILCWNIDNFDRAQIETPSVALNAAYGVTETVAATGRNNYILANLDITDPATNNVVRPDIIVVIEVSTNDTWALRQGVGQLASGAGGQGAVLLLGRIRHHTGNDAWMLVPPLQTGPREAVAVFYDSTNYAFTGPWRWSGGNGPSQPAAAPMPYPAPFRDVMPDADIPAGLPNAGISEQRLAAATAFTYRVGHAQAGNAIPYGNRRVPYWVTFARVDYSQDPPTVGRTFSLFAIHGPAGNGPAGNYLRGLADVQEIVEPPNVNEVKVVLGDFNLNLMDANLNQTPAYQPLINAQYALALRRPIVLPPAPGVFSGYRGYFATHMRVLGLPDEAETATYWFIGNNSDFYPAFGYCGSNTATRNYSLDNILVNFGDDGLGAPCGALTHVTALNGVVPVPYTAHAIPNNAPAGYYQWPLLPQMATVADYGNPPAQIMPPPPADPRLGSLRQWNNYGHIRCTSDHIALVADV